MDNPLDGLTLPEKSFTEMSQDEIQNYILQQRRARRAVAPVKEKKAAVKKPTASKTKAAIEDLLRALGG